MYVFLEQGTRLITSVIHIRFLSVSSNYIYLYFLTNSSFFVWKFWLILLLVLMKGCWKVSCRVFFFYFLAGLDTETLVWLNNFHTSVFAKTSPLWHYLGHSDLTFSFPLHLLNNNKELNIRLVLKRDSKLLMSLIKDRKQSVHFRVSLKPSHFGYVKLPDSVLLK